MLSFRAIQRRLPGGKYGKTNQKCNNNSEGAISDQSKDADIYGKVKQKKKKRKQKKRRNNSKVDISDNNTHRSKHYTINMPQELESNDQKHNGDEYGKCDGECEDIEDQEYNHISINNNSKQYWPMHNVKQIENISDQSMHYNYSYFSNQHDNN